MKYTLRHKLIHLFILNSLIVFSQNVKVGGVMANYLPVNISFNSAPKNTSESVYFTVADSLLIDLDADSLMDIKIKSEFSFRNSTKIKTSKCISLSTAPDLQVITRSEKNKSVVSEFEYGTQLTNDLAWTNIRSTKEKHLAHILNFEEATDGYKKEIIKYGIDDHVGYFVFRKIIPQDTIYGWIQFDFVYPGKVLIYSYECIGKSGVITPAKISSPRNYVCSNGELPLIFFPENGVIIGRGVKDRTFFPSNNQLEFENIYYTTANAKGCPNTASITIEIKQAPKVTIDVLRENKDSVIFVTNPKGGVFEGDGLVNDVFLYSHKFNYDVNYTYKDTFGCESTVRVSNKFSNYFDKDNKIESSKNAKVKFSFMGKLILFLGGLSFAALWVFVTLNPTLGFGKHAKPDSYEDYVLGIGLIGICFIVASLVMALSDSLKNKEEAKLKKGVNENEH